MIVDVGFRLRGTRIPADHGYLLYGAATSALPELHRDGPSYAIHPVRGKLLPGRELELGPQSELTFRLDRERVSSLLTLVGRELWLGRHAVNVDGLPAIRELCPAAALASRLVVIKGFREPGPFLLAARRQLDDVAPMATLALARHRAGTRFEARSAPGVGPVRRTLRVRDKEIVGFAVHVLGLTAEESLVLQERGLGGRQHFGCGVLVPWERRRL